MTGIHWLSPSDPPEAFPPVDRALREPNGLLAAGGDLSVPRLLAAYARGIFPWYEDGQPVLWWSPDPRAVLLPDELHVSRSLRRRLRRTEFRVSADRDFPGVVAGCAAPRRYASGTWITAELAESFLELHRLGHAHSVEVWDDAGLAGGVYGLALGKVFFGESMFSRRNDASKIALRHLALQLRRHNYGLIDCQVRSAHLDSLGSRTLPRQQFVARIAELVAEAPLPGAWEEREPSAAGA